MSVVAWDGKIIAADKLCVSADMRSTTTKIVRLPRESQKQLAGGPDLKEVVLAWVGEQGGGLALLDWYKSGCNPADWPAAQRTADWTRLLVADKDGVVFYEREPRAQKVEEPFMAWGSGRDFAMGAMAMGADARQAVEVASRFSTNCGGGVDWYDLQ